MPEMRRPQPDMGTISYSFMQEATHAQDSTHTHAQSMHVHAQEGMRPSYGEEEEQVSG